MHLLAVARHGSGAVLAQAEVGGRTNEIGAAPALPGGLDLPGTATTADAMLARPPRRARYRAGGAAT